MARTKRSRRSYGAGEWGRNRVRVFPDPKTGLYQIEWRENGRRSAIILRRRSSSSGSVRMSVFLIEKNLQHTDMVVSATPEVNRNLNGLRRFQSRVLRLEGDYAYRDADSAYGSGSWL